MADESILAIPGLTAIKYDLNFYKEYLGCVTKLVKDLNKQGKWANFHLVFHIILLAHLGQKANKVSECGIGLAESPPATLPNTIAS